MLNTAALAAGAEVRHAEAVAREAPAARHERDRISPVPPLGPARSLNGRARHEDALAETQRADEVHRALPGTRGHAEAGRSGARAHGAVGSLRTAPSAAGGDAGPARRSRFDFGHSHPLAPERCNRFQSSV
ncbi:hypothetical protein [Streptomyces sp. NPDC096105]|uniref:hypothetical protein n=1 Tax=Streptomyces sp. NPDC096105 TaxID=3366074 RepID=UPI00382CB51D